MVKSKMNRRGWIRIVEASLAVLIVLGVLIVINSGNKSTKTLDLTEKIPPLLDEIASNQTLREKIVNSDDSNVASVESELKAVLAKRIDNPLLDYTVKICPITDSFCSLSPLPKEEIYVGERIISSTLNQINPKRLKLFIWTK
jgi:hypothetical protein